METVEMDLMQAQIAELTTEVTRLQRSAGGAEYKVEITDLVVQPLAGGSQITSANVNKTWSELTAAINSGKTIVFITTVPVSESTTAKLNSPCTLVDIYDGEIVRINTGCIIEQTLLPVAAELNLYEDELTQDKIDVGGYLIPLVSE